MLSVVLYGCETCCLTLKERHKLRVPENRVLRRVFGPKREKVEGEWRRLHNEEFYDLYVSPNIIRMIKERKTSWGHVARMEEMGNVYKIFDGKPEGKKPIARPRRRLKDNIRMDPREIVWEGVE
jgi:hypothetical protein